MKTKEELKQYYGRNIKLITTQLRNGILSQSQTTVKVYDPYDLSKRIVPSPSCDICIGGYSENSSSIYDIFGGVKDTISLFSLQRYDAITLRTYCENNQVKEVSNIHKDIIKNRVKENELYLLEESKRMIKITNLLK